MKTSILSKIIKKLLIFIFWLLLWQIIAKIINNPILFVSPLDCLIRFIYLLKDINYYKAILTTLTETLIGLTFAYIFAILLSYVAYKHKIIKDFFNPLITVLKSVPVVSIAIIILIWQGNKFLSFFVSFSVIFPNVYFFALSAFELTDKKILEAAKIYRLKSKEIFLYIYRPNLISTLQTTIESSISMAFKSTVAAEVIGLTSQSIGLQFYYGKITLDTASLFCYTITLIILISIIEKITIKLFSLLGGKYD